MSCSGVCWTICKSASRSRQTTTPAPHHSGFYRPDALPAAHLTASKHWRQCQMTVTAMLNFTESSHLKMIPSVLWRCWLGGRKGIRPVKNFCGGVLAWLSVWSEVQTCMWPRWYHCHSLSLASVKSRLVFTFLVLADPGSPGKRAIKRVCVCVCSHLKMLLWFTGQCASSCQISWWSVELAEIWLFIRFYNVSCPLSGLLVKTLKLSYE